MVHRVRRKEAQAQDGLQLPAFGAAYLRRAGAAQGLPSQALAPHGLLLEPRGAWRTGRHFYLTVLMKLSKNWNSEWLILKCSYKVQKNKEPYRLLAYLFVAFSIISCTSLISISSVSLICSIEYPFLYILSTALANPFAVPLS